MWYNNKCFIDFTFAELPVEFVLPLKDMTVKEAATAILECEVNKPDVTATWTKNTEPITVADGYDIRKSKTHHSLQMSKVTPDDTAEYTITIGDKSSTAKLTVEGMFC